MWNEKREREENKKETILPTFYEICWVKYVKGQKLFIIVRQRH